MHIGLYTGAITSAQQTDVGGNGQDADILAPVPGILDAPNVVILGASLINGGFGLNSEIRAEIASYAQAAGFTGTFHLYSEPGEKIDGTIAKHALAAADPAISATQGSNLYLVHTGGNNVSSYRPWPGRQDEFEQDYTALMQQITTSGDRVVPLPLTKRLYPDSPAVIHGDVASEENGSKPYNENIIYPAIQSVAPEFRNAPNAPFVNPYDLADRYPHLLGSDGIHGYAASLGRYILAHLAGRALGKRPNESRAGSSILYSIESGDPNFMTIGAMNVFKSVPGGFLNNPLLCGSATLDGGFDPFIEVFRGGLYQNPSSNAGTGTFARIPDSRFHIPELVNNGIYLQGTKVFTLVFAQLVPGDTVTISAVGVRNAGNTNRRATVSLSTGQSLELDSSNVAASNMIVFDPVEVPSDGSITLSLAVAPGSTYAYLHGVILDFS
ncbi:MAG: hypothetical protein AB8B85_07945 [Paracoccaceae bacterium]